MSDAALPDRSRLTLFPDTAADTADLENPYTLAALERHKREGLELAVRARWIAMAVTGLFLLVINPTWEVLYYEFILALIAANGWLMRRVGRVGQSRTELLLIFLDLLIMTFGMVCPNPFAPEDLPVALQYRFDNFQYFFLILAAATMAYSWRTVIAVGSWTVAMWSAGLGLAIWLSQPVPGLSEAASDAFGHLPRLMRFLDPNSFDPALRFQEILVFFMVAVMLGFSVRRFNRLLLTNAGLERERANLSRYFSPNVVDELSQNDEPLKQIREQDIAVMFVDIVGFTQLAESCDARAVIDMLRGFHGRMEAQVFRHNGTLDKYLGDGLMATFGTPMAGDRDASNALDCALAMLESADQWNRDRRRQGMAEITVSIGLHYGPAVLGDIGANRLEFAVIGTTVNVSSRLERLSRALSARLVISAAARARVLEESAGRAPALDGFTAHPPQEIRGLVQPMAVWTRS